MIFDSHTHSRFSADSKAEPRDMMEAALKKGLAGLCVTDTNLMTPRKSVTAILGVSGHPVKGKLAGCGHCVLRTRCEYRKRGKTCASE